MATSALSVHTFAEHARRRARRMRTNTHIALLAKRRVRPVLLLVINMPANGTFEANGATGIKPVIQRDN